MKRTHNFGSMMTDAARPRGYVVHYDSALEEAYARIKSPKHAPIDIVLNVLLVVSGAMVLVALFLLIITLSNINPAPENPLDLNHDGRITSSDLLLAKRMEIQIKNEILGISPSPGAGDAGQ